MPPEAGRSPSARDHPASTQGADELEVILRHAPMAIAVFDRNMRYVAASLQWLQAYHLPDADLVGRSHYEVFPEISDEWKRVHRRALAGEASGAKAERFVRADGSEQWIHWEVWPWGCEGGEPNGIAIMTEDVTVQKLADRQIREAALHDKLTGLPNRSFVLEFCNRMIAAAERKHSSGALLFIDLDGFKAVNDLHGHEAGDRLLQEVAKRLRSCTRQEDLAGRLGGDEFVVVLPYLDGAPHRAAKVAGHVIDALNQPFEIGGAELRISASIGISLFFEHASNVDTLLRTADRAMYQAKQLGKGRWQFYSRDLDRHAEQLQRMEQQLEQAIASGRLSLVYQPVLDVATGRLVGAEALVRMKDDSEAWVGPDQFIPVAESSGLIHALGAWVIAEACRQQAAWRREGLDLAVSVNIGAPQLRSAGLAATLQQALASNEIGTGRLELEVAEAAVMENLDKSIGLFHQLRSLGVKIVIDDVGTGLSSLGTLSALPLDKLKLDRSLVADIGDAPSNSPAIEALIALGHGLHLTVQGEGIESEQALRYLRERGCELAQGFWFSPPLPAAQLRDWWAARQPTH